MVENVVMAGCKCVAEWGLHYLTETALQDNTFQHLTCSCCILNLYEVQGCIWMKFKLENNTLSSEQMPIKRSEMVSKHVRIADKDIQAFFCSYYFQLLRRLSCGWESSLALFYNHFCKCKWQKKSGGRATHFDILDLKISESDNLPGK